MGLGGISIGQLLLILLIVLLVFGGKRLRNLGNDLGSALKSFRNAMNEEDKTNSQEKKDADKNKTLTNSSDNEDK